LVWLIIAVLQASGRGTLKAARALRDYVRHLASSPGREALLLHCAVGLFVAMGYFLAARLGLRLLTELEGVAVFWPASGIAAGVLVAMGRRVRVPVALGVMVATVAANLLGDRNLWSAVSSSLCNAGEALLAAWLIDRWFGQPFRLDDLHRVLGFLAAATIATAASAVGGAITMDLFHTDAPLLSIWRVWLLSDGMGIVTVAPLIIGLGQLRREPLARRELAEGMLALGALALLSAFSFVSPVGSWITLVPVAVLFPLLLWVAARCRPVFAAAAAFIVAIALVATTTFGIGRFGDPSTAVIERVHAAQVAMLVTTLCALVLAALFDERRRSESALTTSNERLQDSNESLQLALGGAKLGAFSMDLASGRLDCDARVAFIHGHSVPPTTIKDGRRFVHPEDRARIDAAFAEVERTGGTWNAEYRVVHPLDHPLAGETHWVAFDGSVVCTPEGAPVRLLGVARDITEHKRAERRLQQQVDMERHVLARISAGVSLTEVLDDVARGLEQQSEAGRMVAISILDKQGRRLLHGAAPSLPKAYNDAIDGVAIGPAAGSCGTAAFRGEPVIVTDVAMDPLWADYRDLAAAHGLRACWSMPVKAADGRVLGTFAIYYREPRSPTQQDLNAIVPIAHTVALAIERHAAEQALRESQERLSSSLDAAGIIGTWDWYIATDTAYCDAQLSALCSVDPQVGEDGAPLSEYFRAVHPDDVGRLQAAIERAMATGEKFSQDCRLVQKDGGVRWVIARGQCLYDAQGAPLRFPGAMVDVTECRQAEFALKESETRLQQALAAGQVMAFDWDPRSRRSQRSENTLQILGLEPRQQLDDVGDQFLSRVHPDDRARFRTHVYGVSPDCPSYSVKFRFLRPDGRELWLEETAQAEFDIGGHILRLKGLTRDVTELKRAEEHQSLLVAELDHRVKNALACVSAMAQRSREGSSTMDEFLEVLDGRITSMANAHALLSRGRWQGVSLAELVHCELAPCVGEGNASVEGPEVVLVAEATQAVATVLHELVTNAAKYGALSTPHGRVCVRWDWRPNGGARQPLVIEWQETGGPAVVATRKAGYGTSVICDLVPYELGGTVDLVFAVEGVRCRLEIPADWLSSAVQHARHGNGSGSALLHHAARSGALLR
jgi:PAS domain S-box-containing protein